MEPEKLHFDVRDLFCAPRLALSGKKIWIFLVGSLIGYIFYFALNYLAFILAGQTLNETWISQGLYPCIYLIDAPWYAKVLFWISIVNWTFILGLAFTAVSRVTYKQLKGNKFYSSGESWVYVKEHWHAVIFTSISLALIVVFFISIASILALLGKIPYLGEFLFAIPYLLYIFGALFTLYSIIVFTMSLIYTPTIVGVLEEDTMGSVFINYSITWSQLWRVLAYHSILLPLSVIALFLFKFSTFYGIKMVNIVFGHNWLMGEKLERIISTAIHYVWPYDLFTSVIFNLSNLVSSCIECANEAVTIFQNFYLKLIPISSFSLSGTEGAASLIVGIFLFIITFCFLSYFMAILSVGETIMLIIFRKKSYDINILKLKDEEELKTEEELNQGNTGDNI